ncbi:probable endonuclease 4 [Candidatus Vecturithrix granuli]|uniref:Probable endonuclease 4 n=1 Tax=Vecturithrix granuli TaxID=1499967 RepID=A0A081BTT0_VECG1|nr:probable endonuclease 4 [Candidatus Vecturithrix granuli]
MRLLGSHVSIAGGLHKAFVIGGKIGCTAIQIFTKNASRWEAIPLDDEKISQFQDAWNTSGIQTVIAHDSYLINLGSPQDELWQKSQYALFAEALRCEQLGIPYLVIHPGSHVGSGQAQGLRRVARALNRIHQQTPGHSTQILLETTAGQGTNLGYQFEHLTAILDLTQEPERLGICFDTCHVFAAGYELRTKEGFQRTFDAFDRLLGIKLLKVIHVNDSVKPCGSRVDRHQGIGEGEIGLDGFRWLMTDSRFETIPMILETPKGRDPVVSDQHNLRILKDLCKTIER